MGATGATTGSSGPTTPVASTTVTSRPATTPPLTAAAPIPTATANDLKKNSAHHSVPVDGEKFLLKVDYWTTVDSATWSATGSKDVHLLAYVDPAAGTTAPSVVVEQFDAAFTLQAATPGLDGLPVGRYQDMVGSNIPGFLITPTISYGTAFGTTGISQDLLQRWQFLAGAQPLTEAALQRAGVYAVAVSVTYRLLVRNPGDAGWHRRTAQDDLVVPVRSVRAAVAAPTS